MRKIFLIAALLISALVMNAQPVDNIPVTNQPQQVAYQTNYKIAERLVATGDFKIANVKSSKKFQADNEYTLWLTGVAYNARFSEHVAFEVEYETAVEINKLKIGKNQVLELFIYHDNGRVILGSYQLVNAK